MLTIAQVTTRTYSNRANALRALRATGAGQRHPQYYAASQTATGWQVHHLPSLAVACTAVAVARANRAAARAALAAQAPAPARNPVGVTRTRGRAKGLVRQANRATANGVTAPSAGGVCAAVWAWCAAYLAQHGKAPTPKPAKAWAVANGYSPITATIQLYTWRKHVGL